MFSLDRLRTFFGSKQKHPLSNLLDEMRSHFKDHQHKKAVVQKSIPILFFGDLDAYRNSKKRILTVALNPSDKEFSEARFDVSPSTLSDDSQYIKTLSEYFESNPYRFWFNHFEKLLQTIGASYYSRTSRPIFAAIKPDAETDFNRALHTDICSPIATSVTWSKLKSKEDILLKQELQRAGTKIWRDLIEYLNPDIILISGGKYLCDFIPGSWTDLTLPKDFNPSHQLRFCEFSNAKVFWLSGKNVPVSFRDTQLRRVWALMEEV